MLKVDFTFHQQKLEFNFHILKASHIAILSGKVPQNLNSVSHIVWGAMRLHCIILRQQNFIHSNQTQSRQQHDGSVLFVLCRPPH